MKQCLIVLLILCVCSASAGAADIVTYQAIVAKNDGTKQSTTVRFDHAAHAGRYVAGNDCAACHAGKPKKIAINRKNAHADACLNCHKSAGGSKAPVLCADCHK
jgi:hypothetical protein